MTDEEVHEYIHESIHELIDLNEKYHQEFRIGEYERWFYDLEKATLTFSKRGVPFVVADIQAAGTIANKSKSWLWSWDNDSLPDHVKDSVIAVREFGEKNNILKLKEAYWKATEEDGWEMAAVANRIIGGSGVYRCPDEKGLFFLVLTNIHFVQAER